MLPLQHGMYLAWGKGSGDLGEGQWHTKTSGFRRDLVWVQQATFPEPF